VIERSATVQAKAQARWLHNFFAESDFKTFVQPVVVFPGWYVEKFDMKAAGVWVLEPKCLEGFLEKQPDNLSQETVRALASALASFIRQRYGT
jgi:hypothetical protein